MTEGVKNKRVLVTPLDWGLGHATRCIPVIRELQKQGADVFVASSGDALHVLKDEFPENVFFEITPYRVHYSRTLPFMVSMLLQLPKFINAIRQEKKEIRKIVAENKMDVIISDNRFGCRVKGVVSIFITHQVNLLMPAWLRWAAPLINYFNHQQINKFDQCWIPDEENHSITGRLTQSTQLKLKFIGTLSRFQKRNLTEKYDLLVLLSGPEPQRTMMEEEMVQQLSVEEQNVLVVRGLVRNQHSNLSVPENVTVSNYMNAMDLNVAIEESALVICRSGYSTIMDLMTLGKKAVFIPTSGQTEQEYLARVLSERKMAYCTTLDQLNLKEAIKRAADFSGWKVHHHHQLLATAIKEIRI